MLPPSTVLVGIELDEFLGHHLVRYYMIRQNALQPGLVLGLEQAFHRTGRQPGEGFVGGREHRERTGPFQRVHQARGFHSGYQGLELSGSGYRIHDGGRGSFAKSHAEYRGHEVHVEHSGLSGRLELRAGEDKHELAEGDAIYFDSTVPHGYRRVGAKRTTALVVALGPRE